jgi:hypothetical protein
VWLHDSSSDAVVGVQEGLRQGSARPVADV